MNRASPLTFELGLERRGIDEPRRHPEARSEFENLRVRLVRENLHDLRAAKPARLLGFKNRRGIRAATGTENHDAHGVQSRRS